MLPATPTTGLSAFRGFSKTAPFSGAVQVVRPKADFSSENRAKKSPCPFLGFSKSYGHYEKAIYPYRTIGAHYGSFADWLQSKPSRHDNSSSYELDSFYERSGEVERHHLNLGMSKIKPGMGYARLFSCT